MEGYPGIDLLLYTIIYLLVSWFQGMNISNISLSSPWNQISTPAGLQFFLLVHGRYNIEDLPELNSHLVYVQTPSGICYNRENK